MNAQPPAFVAGFETATPACGVALATVSGALVAQAWREGNQPASPLLLADLDRLLREAGADRAAVSAIAVTQGPGAFTGLRVGLALAKTLAHALRVPLFVFSTLAMLARRWPGPALVATLLDARRGEIYAGLFQRHGDDTESLMPECVGPLPVVAGRIGAALAARNPACGPLVCMGRGAEKFWPEWSEQLPAAQLAPTWLCAPAADAVALAGAEAFRTGRPPTDPLAAEPVYLRASDAALRHPLGVVAGGAA